MPTVGHTGGTNAWHGGLLVRTEDRRFNQPNTMSGIMQGATLQPSRPFSRSQQIDRREIDDDWLDSLSGGEMGFHNHNIWNRRQISDTDNDWSNGREWSTDTDNDWSNGREWSTDTDDNWSNYGYTRESETEDVGRTIQGSKMNDEVPSEFSIDSNSRQWGGMKK
ncbi:hypothetical protein ScPMuIL_006863 [Solemya velum]